MRQHGEGTERSSFTHACMLGWLRSTVLLAIDVPGAGGLLRGALGGVGWGGVGCSRID
jgi:hypothetical protein